MRTNITINCRYCKKIKGCEIKNQFRKLGESFDGNISNHTFKLKCPLKETGYKFDKKESIEFTFGYGHHIVPYKWVQRGGEYSSDYEHIFENNKYKGYVSIKGEVFDYISPTKYIIYVTEEEFEKHKHLFNESDLKRINEINEKLHFCEGDNYYFCSKVKFIK